MNIDKLLKDRYFLSHETCWDDIAKRVSVIYPEIYEDIRDMKFIPSSPTLMNCNTGGKRIGTLSSCFPMGIEDSIEGIFDAVKECAIVSKAGGGVGYNFSHLRSSNENVKSIGNRKSSGPLAFIDIFNSVLEGVSQGGIRRGAGMAQLNIHHPDILNFIKVKKEIGKYNRFNFSIRIPNLFYSDLRKTPDKIFQVKNVINDEWYDLKENNKKITYKELWDKIIESAWTSAEPGIFNSDIAFDRFSVKNLSGEILGNPCVTGETLLRSPLGDFKIKDLVNNNVQEIPVYCCDPKNGDLSIKIGRYPRKTGEKQKIYKVTIHKGKTGKSFIKVTGNHNFLGINGEKITTLELKKKLEDKEFNTSYSGYQLKSFSKYKYKIRNTKEFYLWNNGKEIKESHFIAEWKYGRKIKIGEVIHHKDGNHLNNYPDNIIILNKNNHNSHHNKGINNPRYGVKWSKEIRNKINKSKKTKYNCLKCGITINTTKKNKQDNLCNLCYKDYYNLFDGDVIKKRFIRLSLNIATYIDSLGIKFNENNWNNLNKKYGKKNNKVSVLNIIKYFGSWDRFEKSYQNYNSRVISIEEDGYEDVYNITVDDYHTVAWNDLITFNCNEFLHLPYTSCCLGSINLSKLVTNKKFDWNEYESLIIRAADFLNKIIDNNTFPLKVIKDITLVTRPIGLGYMGLAHTLYKMGIPYNSEKAIKFTEDITKYLTLVSMRHSCNTAKYKGCYKTFDWDYFFYANRRFFTKKQFKNIDVEKLERDIKKHGVFNSTFTAIAPTGTISTIAQTSSGIEPIFALLYKRRVEKINNKYEEMFIIDPIFEKYLDENLSDKKEKILEEISNNKGSCQKCKDISDEIKKVFVIASDLTPMEHLDVLEAGCKGVSMGISKTINLSSDCTKEDISNIYLEAYKREIIGVTVYRDSCREGILVHKDNDDEVIIEKNAPKRPKSLPCHVYRVTVHGEQWRVFIGLYKNHPYEAFAGKVNLVDIPSTIEEGVITKVKKGIYQFEYNDEVLIKDIITIFESNWEESLTRQISTNLRHGTPINFIVEQLSKKGTVVDFNIAIARALKRYMKNREDEVCPECGAKLKYTDGCISCQSPDCVWSKCG